MIIKYTNYEIELLEDELSQVDLAKSSNKFNFEYGDKKNITVKLAVFLKKEGVIIRSAVLYGNKGITCIHEKSAIVFDDMLILCVSSNVFSLYLPSLELRWVKEFDKTACLQLFKTSESYLIHGESAITRITFTGKVIWSYSDKTIFRPKQRKNSLKLTARGIEIKDGSSGKHLLGYDGRLLAC